MKDGAILPKGAKGDQIRKVVKFMDGPISKILPSGLATVELELWRVHAENISKVCSDGGKHRGCQAYHPTSEVALCSLLPLYCVKLS